MATRGRISSKRLWKCRLRVKLRATHLAAPRRAAAEILAKMDFDDEEVDERSCGGMAEFCCRYKDSLNDREAGFDQQMKARTTLGGRISPKQQAWLEIILWKTEPPKSLRCLAWILAEQREFRLCHLAPMAFVFSPLGYAHLRQRVRAIFGTHPHPFFLGKSGSLKPYSRRRPKLAICSAPHGPQKPGPAMGRLLRAWSDDKHAPSASSGHASGGPRFPVSAWPTVCWPGH